MKTRFFAILLAAAPFLTSAQSIPVELPADANSAVNAAREAAPQAVEKIEKKAGDAADKIASKKGGTQSATRNVADPAGWGPEEIRKLAVMDIRVGKETRTVMFELFTADAPKTVANFIANADSSVYNGLAVHRTIDSYLIQTGDPLTADDDARDKWGTGGQDRLPPEFKRSHKMGAVAMARRGDKINPSRLSNDSQFYFVLGNMAPLDGQYSVFGQVVSGLEELEAISYVPTDSNDCPLERVEIKSLRVIDHKGPLVVTRSTGAGRKATKPFSAKGPFERFLERGW